MKKLIKGVICAGLMLMTAVIPGIQARAQEEENRILTGVYVEEMSLEGKTESKISGRELCEWSFRQDDHVNCSWRK